MPRVHIDMGQGNTRVETVSSTALNRKASGWIEIPDGDGGTVEYPMTSIHRIEHPDGGA